LEKTKCQEKHFETQNTQISIFCIATETQIRRCLNRTCYNPRVY